MLLDFPCIATRRNPDSSKRSINIVLLNQIFETTILTLESGGILTYVPLLDSVEG